MAKKETLRTLLEGDLRVQIDEVWRKAKEYHSNQEGDNIQGTLHCETVETNLCKLISDDKKKELGQISLFVLSAAACLHDIGKVVSHDAKLVEEHGKRSMQIVLENYRKLGIDKGQAIAVAYIVSVHGHGRLDELPRAPVVVGDESVNITELAVVFRLADILDTSYRRAPEILSDIKFPSGDVPSKWRGRKSITGWFLNEKRIIIQAAPKKEEIDAVYTLWAMINEEISNIAPYLKLYGYPHELGKLEIGNIFLEPELGEGAVKQRPFPGMAFYERKDVSIFKGRDDEIEKLLSIASAYPITLLVGESGSGKTSLIHAGLFPLLEQMSWKSVWTRPFDSPIENNKKTIWNAFFEGEAPNEIGLLDVMKKVAKKCKPHKLLIVMDQFEDVLNCNDQRIMDDFCGVFIAVQTGTIIPNLRILISFREDALVKLNSRLLKKITGSVRQFPSVELERLTRDGAKQAIIAGLKNAGLGIDSRQEEGEKPLSEIILDDIQKGGDRLYPPYVQMVAETLCKKVDRHRVITRETYSKLGSADNIIARYLMELLNEFGSERDKAEKVLISLTSSAGKKVKKNLSELIEETEMEINELKVIMNKMIDLRMARSVNVDEFEIIHDYLGEIVDEELVKEEDRTIKSLEEQLEAFYQNYKVYGTPLDSTPFLAKLYRNRRRIRIDKEKYPFVLCTILMKKRGLGWFWLRDIDTEEIVVMIKDHISHDMSEIGDQAKIAFAEIAQPKDKEKIFEMLNDKDRYVRKAASIAFVKIAGPEDKEKIFEMLDEYSKYVREAAAGAFVKIAQPKDKEKIFEMLDDKGRYVRWAAARAFIKIAQPKDKEKIFEMLYDKDEVVRKAASIAFVNTASPEDRSRIIGMLHHEDEDFREAARMAFVKIAQHGDKDEIIRMLHNEDRFVWMAAARAFVKIAQPKDRRKILEMIDDRNQLPRRAAKRAFLKIAQPKDKEKIFEMLYDKDEMVREAAARAFVKIAGPEDKEKIFEMLDEYSKYVREAAAGALIKIAQPEDKEKIFEMLDDKDEDVRRAAVEAFVKIASFEDKENLLDKLSDLAQGYGEEQVSIFQILSKLDKMFYCPYLYTMVY